MIQSHSFNQKVNQMDFHYGTAQEDIPDGLG